MSRFTKFLQSLHLRFKHFFLRHTGEFRKFKKSRGVRILFLDTPTHGNLGDQAIAVAMENFVCSNKSNSSELVEFSQGEYLILRKDLEKEIRPTDIILIPGGGFVGSLWENEQAVVMDILSRFPSNKTIIFPQTIHFSETDTIAERAFVKQINCRENLFFFVRDQKSFDYLDAQKVHCHFKLVPDVVFLIKRREMAKRKNGRVLLVLRQDKEKVLNHDRILKALDEEGIGYDFSTTILGTRVNRSSRKKEVENKIEEFSSYSLVITDRLHGMIFSYVAKTPCIAFDNISKKVSGVYKWIEDYPGVLFCDSLNQVSILSIQKMMSLDLSNESSPIKDDAFAALADLIAR